MGCLNLNFNCFFKEYVMESPNYCIDCDSSEKISPAERVVVPRDVIDFNEDEEALHVIGTKDGKITAISGLEKMSNLKVISFKCKSGSFTYLFCRF
jgi:hypothetical protein